MELRGKTFRIDQPGYLPGPLAITYTDILVILSFAGVVARLTALLFDGIGSALGFIAGTILGYGAWQAVKRALPGPNATYYADWVSIQADHYTHLADEEHYPLIVYGK